MITHTHLKDQLLAYLNHETSKTDLVRWAEDAYVQVMESDEDVPDEDQLIEILSYIGAADSPGFPLTWEVLSQFLDQLGVRIHITAESA